MKSFKTNWRTTGAGVLTVAVGVGALFGVTVAGSQPVNPDVAVYMILTGIGLIFAKDGNVTGGTTRQ